MPIVEIHLMEGRSIDQKRDLVQKVTDAICQSIDIKPEKVKIILSDMSKENYAVAGKLKLDQN